MDDAQQAVMSRFFSESTSPEISDFITDSLTRLKAEPEKKQLDLIQELAGQDEKGLTVLMKFLLERQSEPVRVADGKAYQALYAIDNPTVQEFLHHNFPTGIVPLESDKGIDYKPLQLLLAKQDFLEADRLTLAKLCELAGSTAFQRNWLYFTEVEQFPIRDLQTIDTLWLVHSEGKFGFSIQRDLWLSVGKDWDKLWSLIGWRSGNNWTRYPQGFIWSLTAPKGHLPLSNQLRGVRVIASLLNHPAWTTPKG